MKYLLFICADEAVSLRPGKEEEIAPAAQAWVAEFSQALRPYVNGAYVNVPNPAMLDWETAY